MRSFKTPLEQRVGRNMARLFTACRDPVATKLAHFPKYVRRQHLKRFLAMYEIFNRVLPIKGSVVDCGVYKGFSLMSWAKLSAMLEPENLTRRIYGFDSFTGFTAINPKDRNRLQRHRAGDFAASSYRELKRLIKQYDHDRFLGHIPKVHLIKGDVCTSVPRFIRHHQHLLVSLLFCDLDLYEPTKVVLENFVPRMPKGAVLAFDELDNPLWPGETLALLECCNLRRVTVQRLSFDPYIGFVVL